MMALNPVYQDAPFDDDDLINDYIEDEMIPPEYDDAYLEEMMGEHGGGETATATATATAGRNSGTAQVQTGDQINRYDLKGQHNNCMNPQEVGKDNNIGIPMADTDGDVIMEETNGNSGGVPMEVTVDQPMQNDTAELNLSSLRKDKESSLYSFERYSSSKLKWRQKSLRLKREEQDVMAATQWRQKVKNKESLESGKRRNINRTNNPESQLVQFMSNVTKGSDSLIGSLGYSQTRFQIKSRLPVANEQSSPITINGGKMIYVPKVKDDLRYVRCNESSKATTNKESDLLGIPLSELLRRTEVIERRNMKRKRIRRETDANMGDESDKDMNDASTNDQKKKESQLWVDKHAPKSFTDLLSDERTNREVLRALREWDPFVFQKEPPKRPQKNAYNKDQSGSTPNNITASETTDEENAQSSDLRPSEQKRVILLSGPPGVGKTTLAHIVARHAGYRPLEVNASDERSASVLIQRITNAMESATLNLKQRNGQKNDDLMGRPNCLILDEIDGADAKSSMSAIVEIIRADKSMKGGNKKRSKKTYLRRPIIFICNHKYAAALRPLLPFARQFDVLPPSPMRLISRLKAVLNKERMTLVGGSNLLRQLVGSTGGDIRSCLYTLQFASARAREIYMKSKNRDNQKRTSHSAIVDISPVLNIALNGNGRGMKDIRADIAGTLRSVFRKVKTKKQDQLQLSHSSKGVETVLSTVETFSDPSKTLDGLFLNLMNVSYIDPTLDRCWTAHEWISSVDLYRSQNISVASTNHAEHRMMQNSHIPSAAAAIHVLCRVESNAELTFSLRPLLDSLYQFEVNCGLINKFFEGLCPRLRSSVTMRSFTSEVLPYCLNLLLAGVGDGALNRPVSSVDIMTDEERISFDAHVQLIQYLGLTYKKSEVEEEAHNHNEVHLRLEPEIDHITKFRSMEKPGYRTSDVPSVLKELIAHAASIASMKDKDTKEIISKEKVSNDEEKNDEESISQKKVSALKRTAEQSYNSMEMKRNKAAMNFLGIGAAKAKAARSARKAALVGFHRSKRQKKMSNTGSGVPIEEVIRFKYQKGFTQAVRLPCSRNDFTIL